MPLEYQYNRKWKQNKLHWFYCSRCAKEFTVERTGYIYIGYSKVSCLKCATKEEIIERSRANGGRDREAFEMMEALEGKDE